MRLAAYAGVSSPPLPGSTALLTMTYLGLGDPGYRGDSKGIASAIQLICSCRLSLPE